LNSPADPGRELRRLRAALGASADALLSRGANPARLLEEEVAFLQAICEACDRPELLREVWRDLRNRSLTLAADLEPSAHSLALLRAKLEAEDAIA
jgi:DNA-binding GntR family transcriptional regulator